MKRTWRLAGLGLALLVLSGCSALRLARSRRDSQAHFPLAVGSEWEYALVTTIERSGRTDTTTRARYIQRVVGTAPMDDGATAFTRVWTSEVTLIDTILAESTFSEAETSYYRVTPSAVLRYLTPRDRPDTILRFPLAVDLRWQSGDVNYWVMSRDNLLVAGEIYNRCWRVKTTTTGSATPTNSWFAPGVGLVRLLSDRSLAGGRLRTDYYLVRMKLN